ncbi:unnamed protein product [Durusdinium trenchii]
MTHARLLALLDQEEQQLLKIADDSCMAIKENIQEAVMRMHQMIWDMKMRSSTPNHAMSIDEVGSTSQPNEVNACAEARQRFSPTSPMSPMSSGDNSIESDASGDSGLARQTSFQRHTTPAPPAEALPRAHGDDGEPMRLSSLGLDSLSVVNGDFDSEVAEVLATHQTQSTKMGKKVDKFLVRTENNPNQKDLWKMRVQTGMDYVAGGLVLLNSIVMMLELEFEGRAAGVFVGHQSNFDVVYTEELFLALDRIFVILFLLEWCVRLSVEKRSFFRDVANMFDTFLVVAGLVDLVVSLLASDDQGASRSIVVLRLMRALKSLRAIRMVRSLRFFQGLRVLVKACQCFLPSLCWAMVLLGIFMSMGALLLGNLLQDFVKDESMDPLDREWIWMRYGTSLQATYTLFEITFAGSWPLHARPVLEKASSYFVLFFVPYIVIVVFAIIRVIGAVFLKDTLDAAQNDAEQLVIDRLRLKEQYVNKLEGIFRAIDDSGNGLISEERLSYILSNPKVAAYFQTLDLDVHEGAALFHLLDNGDGEVTLDEFIDGIMRCKGPARAIDQVAMHAEIKNLDTKVTKLFKKLMKVSKASVEVKQRNMSKSVTAMKVFRGETASASFGGLPSPTR